MKIIFDELENSIEIKDGLKKPISYFKNFNAVEFGKCNDPNIWKRNR